MNDVIKSGNIIKKIRDGKQLEEIALFTRNCIFRDGPKDALVLRAFYTKWFLPDLLCNIYIGARDQYAI